jgi:signal transduction histidine kinase
MEESDKVLTMIDTLMSVAEAEAGVMKLNLTSTDLDQILRESFDLYEHVAEDKALRSRFIRILACWQRLILREFASSLPI